MDKQVKTEEKKRHFGSYVLCARCESVGRKPTIGQHLAYGITGVKSLVCSQCHEEIQNAVAFLEDED